MQFSSAWKHCCFDGKRRKEALAAIQQLFWMEIGFCYISGGKDTTRSILQIRLTRIEQRARKKEVMWLTVKAFFKGRHKEVGKIPHGFSYCFHISVVFLLPFCCCEGTVKRTLEWNLVNCGLNNFLKCLLTFQHWLARARPRVPSKPKKSRREHE